MAGNSGSISLSLPGPGAAAFIGAGIVAIATACAVARGGPGFLIAAGLVGVAAALVYVGCWIEANPIEILRLESRPGSLGGKPR